MYHYIEYIFDLIFPPSKEASLVRALTPHTCAKYFRKSNIGDVTALSSFKEQTIRALIHEAKFHNNMHAQQLLATFLVTYLALLPADTDSVWIPIPLSPARVRTRGYNQVTEILRCARIQIPHLDVRETVLIRTRDTTPQTTLTRKERLRNMDGAFVVKNPELILGKNIIVLDDVTTTGSTLGAAKAALLPHAPASITLVALAH